MMKYTFRIIYQWACIAQDQLIMKLYEICITYLMINDQSIIVLSRTIEWILWSKNDIKRTLIKMLEQVIGDLVLV